MGRPRSDIRDKILDAADKLLRADGVAGFSQLKVAAAAGVAQGHLTYYFPSRAALLHAVAARFSNDIVDEAARLAARGVSGFDMIARIAQNTKRTRLLVGLLVESEDDSELAAALEQNTQNVLAALSALLGAGTGTGTGTGTGNAGDVETELLLCALWGIAIRHLQRHRRERGRDKRTASLLSLLEARLPSLIHGTQRGRSA